MRVRKRNGNLEEFSKGKITNAIWKAAQDVGGSDKQKAEELAEQVFQLITQTFKEKIPTVEDIQDTVEKVLIENGHAKTAKHYILYRESRKNMRDTEQLFLNSQKIIRDYVSKEDWRVYENANATYSLPGLLWHSASTVMAFYCLHHMYPKEISQPHINGEYHIHNLSMGLAGYCAGWSLRKLLHEGFNGVPGKIDCRPPKHLRSAIGQIINFIGTLQNQWAGAQAFSSFDTYLSPFIKADKLSYPEVKQSIQEYVYNMNIASRWSSQSPFTNITLDINPPEDLKNEAVTVGGKLLNSTYSDYQDEMDMINKAIVEVLTEGDAKGQIFSFPIPTYNITNDFKWDSEISNSLFDMTAKYGIPYFQNFINSDLNPSDVRSMCCRLRLELKELARNTTGGRFGSGESTGSIGVVTINLPRLAYTSKTKEKFYESLDRLLYLAKESLEIKRKTVEKNLQNNLLPHTKRYLGSFKNHFSTIGIIGMHEACLNLFSQGIETTEGKQFALDVLKFIREKLLEFQQETSHLYNLEATPGEGASFRLASKDKAQFSDIITSGDFYPYYTNSTQLPVNYTASIFEALKHQESLQREYSGGTVFHTFLGESINGKQAKMLVQKITTNFKIPYLTITPTFSICEDHGYLKDESNPCPICKKPTQIYSRVVGYIRPVQDWNNGKKEEFRQRKVYSPNI